MFPVYNPKVVDKPGPAFGSIEYVSTKPILDNNFYDNLNYDEEVNRLLDQVEEVFLRDKPENEDFSEGTREILRDKPENDDLPEDIREFLRNNPKSYDVSLDTPKVLRDKPENYDFSEDTRVFFGAKPKNYDFPEDTHHVGSIPDWYRDMLKNKIKEAKGRLEKLSNLVCATSPSTAAHIKRIEEDHSTAFCKMDYPRHPPMHKSWRSTWELRYAKKCKETDSSNHTHLVDCKSLVIEDYETGVRMDTPNISQHDYPPHVIRVARLFLNFARKLNRKINKSKGKEKSECEEKSECKDKSKCKEKSKGIQNVDTIEDDWWTTMTMVLISNHQNELMIVVRRERVNSLIPPLKAYFERVTEKHPNIVSVLVFHTSKMNARIRNWLKKVGNKNNRKEVLIAGTPVLNDVIGPLSMQYDLANHRVFFDSVETMQLGKVIQDYMCLTEETTLLDIGCEFGVLSLIMTHKCQKVIKLTAEPRARWLVNESEKLKKANQIHNVLLVQFNTENIITICEPLIEQCIAVAIVKLKPVPHLGGPLKDVMKALRNLPSIWRVILYGSFTDQLHESIAVLTSEDDSMGERYLPMQGCILDKSPTVFNAFDIVVLFERKSLIAPKIELFAPGPTVNVAVDSVICDNDAMDANEVKLELSLNGDRELANSKEKCEERQSLSTVTKKKSQFLPSLSVRKEFQCISSPPLTKTFQEGKPEQSTNDQTALSLSEEIEFRFDHPPPTLGTFPPFSRPPPPVTDEFQFNFPPPSFQKVPPFHPNPLGPMREDFQNDYPPFSDSRFPNPHFHPDPYPPMREDFQGDYPPSLLDSRFPNSHFRPEPHPPMREDLPFNCPLPLLERHFSASILQGPYPSVRDDFQDHYYPPLPPENYYNSPRHPDPHALVGNEFQNHYPPPPPPPTLPSTLPPVLPKNKKASQPKKKKSHFFYPPPPPTRFPSPPPPPPLPPPEANDLIEKDSSASSSSTTVTDEPVRVCEEEKVNEMVNITEDVISSVMIKSEPIDPSYSADLSEANGSLSEANCHSPTTTVKDELMQVCEEKVYKIVNTVEDVISSVPVKSEPIDPSYSVDLLEANGTLAEASCYSPTTTVKTEPLQNEVKKESNEAGCGTTVKAEPLQDEERKELNVIDSGTSSSVTIKSEPTNQSSSAKFSDTNCQNIALPVTTESESTAYSPIRSPDCEPMDMQISPSPPDFQSMETPIHNPRALSDITPLTLSKNVSVDGSAFSVQTNQSFLSKVEPINVDREPGEISDSDGENEAIGKEKNKQQNKLPRKHVSTAPVVSRKLNRPPRPFPGKYSESPYKRRNHRRSPSPKRMRRSPTPDRRRRRSPLSDRRRERSRRSPLREACGRAKSPRDRRNRRSRSRSPRRR